MIEYLVAPLANTWSVKIYGIKLVDDNELAQFVVVEVIRSTEEGIWVTGLPDQARIISTGQGFVTDGQRVEAVSANELNGTR